MDIFRKKRRRAAQAVKAAEETALQERKSQAFETGLHGTVEEFHQAYEQARENNTVTSLTRLRKGAIQAFLNEATPEKIQLVLSNHRDEYDGSIPGILMSLTKGIDSEQAVANVNLALDKLSEQKKQEMLDHVLRKHIAHDYWDRTFDRDDEVFTDVLLQSGADANADAGRIFALAIADRSPLIVKMLHAHGGDFEDALLVMQIEKWEKNGRAGNCEEKLHIYQGHENRDTIEKWQQNLDDVTRKLEKAEARIIAIEGENKKAAPRPKLQP